MAPTADHGSNCSGRAGACQYPSTVRPSNPRQENRGRLRQIVIAGSDILPMRRYRFEPPWGTTGGPPKGLHRGLWLYIALQWSSKKGPDCVQTRSRPVLRIVYSIRCSERFEIRFHFSSKNSVNSDFSSSWFSVTVVGCLSLIYSLVAVEFVRKSFSLISANFSVAKNAPNN